MKKDILLRQLQERYNDLERERIDLSTYQSNLSQFATDDTGPAYEEPSNEYNQKLSNRITHLTQSMDHIRDEIKKLESKEKLNS